MTTDITLQPSEQVNFGKKSLHELKALIQRRPEKDKLVINGRQYLYFSDWQTLGAFFGLTAKVVSTEELTKDVPSQDGKFVFKDTIGFLARAVVVDVEGREVSAAEAECLFEEKNWMNKARFMLRSMAQTRACAKALRNCLAWVVRLPDVPGVEIAHEAIAEEMPGDSQSSF